MSLKNISCTETAKILRQCLKEAFPDIKFGVKSSTYANGSSIQIRWERGPAKDQVEDVVGKFRAAYFDSSIDYKGSVYHLMDGQPVCFGADFIQLCHDDLSSPYAGIEPLPSKTAGRVFVTHDDGYSRACGSGTYTVGLDVK